MSMIKERQEVYKKAEVIDNKIAEDIQPLLTGNKYDLMNALLYIRTVQSTIDILKVTVQAKLDVKMSEQNIDELLRKEENDAP